MADSADWILKLISGPHQGAEVSLRPGRIVVGSDRECDLVLNDVLVAARHFALSLANGTVTVEPLDGPAFVNGKRLTAATKAPAFGFVSAGTTHLVVGPANARWPLLSIADVPALEKEPEAVAAAPAAAEATPATNGKKTPPPPNAAQRRRAWWTAGIGGALLIVWLILWFTLGPKTALAPNPNLREHTEALLRARPDTRTLRLEEHGDRLVVTGYVESDAVQRDLGTAFRQELPQVTLRIWSTPRLLETARALLAERGSALEVAAAGPGELSIRGTAKSRDEWTRTRQALLTEVPGLQRLREDVTIPVNVPAPVRAAATAPAANAAPAAPAEVLTVIALQTLADGQGWLRLNNGAVLFRGATLPSGGRISRFESDQAVVEISDKRFVLTAGADVAAASRTAAPVPAAAPAPSATPAVTAVETTAPAETVIVQKNP